MNAREFVQQADEARSRGALELADLLLHRAELAIVLPEQTDTGFDTAAVWNACQEAGLSTGYADRVVAALEGRRGGG
jgi:hypothetical protein